MSTRRTMSTVHDLIKWSADPSDMQRFVEKYSRFLPVLVRVSDGYAGRDESLHLFAQNEVYWVYDILKQQRLIATDREDNYISIPMDYKQRFHIIDRQGIKSPPKHLPELLDRLKARDVDFMVEGNHQVSFSVGADLSDKKELGLLRYDMLYELKYLLACPIVDRHLHPRLTAIPTYIPLTLDVAMGFKYGSDAEFQQFGRDLQTAVQRFDKMPLTLCQDILLSDEPPESDYEYVNPVHVIIIDEDSSISTSDCSSPTPSPTGWISQDNHPCNLPQQSSKSGLANGYFLPPRSAATIGQISGCPRFKSKPIMLPPMPPRPPPAVANATLRKPAMGPPVPPRKPSSASNNNNNNSSSSRREPDSHEAFNRRRKVDRDGYLESVWIDSVSHSAPETGGRAGNPAAAAAVSGQQQQNRNGRGSGKNSLKSRRARSMERLDRLSLRRQNSHGSTGDLDSQDAEGSTDSTLALRGNEELDSPRSRVKSCTDSPLARSWDDIGLVPTNIASLSVEEVADCLWLLHLSQYSEMFQVMDVDGQLLVSLNENVLVKDFNFSSFDAIKLMKFATEGWRPLKRSVSPD